MAHRNPRKEFIRCFLSGHSWDNQLEPQVYIGRIVFPKGTTMLREAVALIVSAFLRHGADDPLPFATGVRSIDAEHMRITKLKQISTLPDVWKFCVVGPDPIPF